MKTKFKNLEITFDKEGTGWYGMSWLSHNCLVCGYGETLLQMIEEVYESSLFPEFQVLNHLKQKIDTFQLILEGVICTVSPVV